MCVYVIDFYFDLFKLLLKNIFNINLFKSEKSPNHLECASLKVKT